MLIYMHLTLFQHKYVMGQDSRIYESLFSTPKPGYKSLIDIYLEETSVAAPMPPLPRQQVAVPVEKPSLVPVIPFNKNAEIAPTPWNDIAAKLFEYKTKEQEGRGEYSVAYLLTGLTTMEEIEKVGIIGGKSESVDSVAEVPLIPVSPLHHHRSYHPLMSHRLLLFHL